MGGSPHHEVAKILHDRHHGRLIAERLLNPND